MGVGRGGRWVSWCSAGVAEKSLLVCPQAYGQNRASKLARSKSLRRNACTTSLAPSGLHHSAHKLPLWPLWLWQVTLYVEHPVPIQPPAEAPAPAPQPLKLTKKELKKLRTQRRQAREKEKQDLIR